MSSSVSSLIQTRSNLPAQNTPRLNIISALVFLAPAAIGLLATLLTANPWPDRRGVLGLLLGCHPRLHGNGSARWCFAWVAMSVCEAGPFWILPFVDTIPAWVDQRVITTSFAAEETLTSDTVPVNVDAVLFWMVYDPEKAALEVQNYPQAVSWAAQTALRDIIGRTSLTDLLRGRERIEEELQKLIDERSNPWGLRCNRWRCAM